MTGRFVDHVVALSNRYWPGLFHTYDHPQIPNTTTGLEGFFGSSVPVCLTRASMAPGLGLNRLGIAPPGHIVTFA